MIKVRLQKVNDSSKKFVGVKTQNGDSLLGFLDLIIGHNYPNYQNISLHLSQNKSQYVIKFNGARNIVKLKAVKHRQCRFNYLALNCAAACRLTSNSQLAVQPALT